tara:strand:- start:134 stop:268 length:135 start_codon:yes stop_codon:yes gene_type:complete
MRGIKCSEPVIRMDMEHISKRETSNFWFLNDGMNRNGARINGNK